MGKDFTSCERATDIFVKQDHRWQCVFYTAYTIHQEMKFAEEKPQFRQIHYAPRRM